MSESRFFPATDGLNLHVKVYNETARDTAIPVVCLPGLARNAKDFEALARHLMAERMVLCPDYRGRGLSGYDPDWRQYDMRIEAQDVVQVMMALEVKSAIFVGTSRGGLITMALGAMTPKRVKGVVLNDIGPVVEESGIARIKGYIGKMPVPADYGEGARILLDMFGIPFPALTPKDWESFARATWKETPQGLVPDYDPNLFRSFESLDLPALLPLLWPLFDALKAFPLLVLRGEHSDILSEETVAAMQARHPNCRSVTVPGEGHAPLMREAVNQQIAAFVQEVEKGCL
jgi:pimeloyl-ACP methyl ester carboxylesterase